MLSVKIVYFIFSILVLIACWQAYSISSLQVTGYQLKTRYYVLWLRKHKQLHFSTWLNYLLQGLKFIKKRATRRKEQEEMIMLYELIQADLYTLTDGEQVNIQHVLKDNLPFFPICGDRLMSYLHLWKFNPLHAKKQLQRGSSGELFTFISELLVQLNELPKEQALPVLKNAQDVLSKEFQELRKRRKEKTFISVDLLFFVANITIMLWLLIFIVSMFQHLLSVTHSP